MMSSSQIFLGTGWSFPPSFAANGQEVATVSGHEDIHQSLHILLSTRQGERILRDDFGCDLTSLMFEEVNQYLVNRLTSVISDAILRYETRIVLNQLIVALDPSQQGTLLINLDYSVPMTNSRFNMVYPFYVNEARATGSTA